MNMHFVINQTRTHGNLIEDGFLGVFPRRTRVPTSHHGTRVSRGTHARRSPTRRQRRRGFFTRISFIRAHPRGWWTTARTTGRTTTRPIDRINPSKQSAARERVSGSFFSGDSARARWATRRENATKESASRLNSFSSRVRVASSVGSSVRRPGFGSDRSVDRTEETRSDRTSPPPPPGFVRVLLYLRARRPS